MNIMLNGEKRDVPDGLTVRGLLEHLKIQTEKVAVERNLEIVKKATYDVTLLAEGDSLEVVSFMAGGSSGLERGVRSSAWVNIMRNAECGIKEETVRSGNLYER